KTVTVTGLSVTGTAASNYTLKQPVTTTADITAAPLTIKADPQTKLYGSADPALTYTAAGLQASDTASTVLTGTLTRATGETVAGSPYAITKGTLAANSNYTI